MFKKVEMWVLYLVIFISILFAISFGILVRQELVGKTKLGWISKTALIIAEIPKNTRMIFRNATSVRDRFPNLDGFDGQPNSKESYLLLSRYDGDLKAGVVELVDLTTFEVLHTWNPDIDKFNSMVEQVDDFKYLSRDRNNGRYMLKHPYLTKDNGLFFGGDTSLKKIDACSELVFQYKEDLQHHSIEADIEGNLWTHLYLYPQSLPAKFVGRDHPRSGDGFMDDAILKISSDGEVLFKKSISQILIDNGLEYLLFAHGNLYENDPIHSNDIQPVNFDGEYWKKGDIFISVRNQSMILLYRPETNQIIWKLAEPFFHQHDVDILDDHRISIFNNNSKNVYGDINIVDGNSEVVIHDFKTGQFSSYLADSLADYNMNTITQGRSEILPNGDLFIEETNTARTLYFNADGSLRWTHYNRASNKIVSRINWSRILYTNEDIEIVNNFLINKGTCNE